MFGLIVTAALLLAGVMIVLLTRRYQDAERRAAQAESAAALGWGAGYRAATDEINTRRDNESHDSYRKGREVGWNDCVDEYETRQEPQQAHTA